MRKLLIHSNDRVVAILQRGERSAWQVDYLEGVSEKDALNPALPVAGRTFQFGDLPAFVGSLLPDDARRVWLAKMLKSDSDDFTTLICHCLGNSNVGHIKVTPALDDLDTSAEGLSYQSPVPALIAASSINVLENPKLQMDLPLEIQKKAGVSGIGGSFPKAFFRCPEGEFIMKHYPEAFQHARPEECAKMEETSLQAAASVGLEIARPRAFGPIVLSERFDTVPGTKVYHLRDITGAPKKYAGTYEELRRVIEQQTGFEGAVDFTKHVIFALLLGDSDKHQENCAIIDRGGRTKLSPLYDMLPSSHITGDPESLGLPISGRKTKIGWTQIEQFSRGYMSPEEVVEFGQSSLKAIEKLVLPSCGDMVAKRIARHTFVYKRILAEKCEYGQAAKSLSQSLSARLEPREKLSHTPLPPEMAMRAAQAIPGKSMPTTDGPTR